MLFTLPAPKLSLIQKMKLLQAKNKCLQKTLEEIEELLLSEEEKQDVKHHAILLAKIKHMKEETNLSFRQNPDRIMS